VIGPTPSEKQYNKMSALRHTIISAAASLLCIMSSCAGSKKEAAAAETDKLETPAATFNADSAMHYVRTQVEFGPRVNNTPAHKATSGYLRKELARHGAKVVTQEATLRSADGVDLRAMNIMGMYNPEATDRLLLLAHYDTRPWADEDPDPNNHTKPVPGANDGASGVGVLLEIARQLGSRNPDRGVDILFVDAEDRGTHTADDSWALGARYFAQNPISEGYAPAEAILLDMVGGENATFGREHFSNMYAPELMNRIWAIAKDSGFGEFFKDIPSGAVTDDHVELIQAGIPAIDIIDFRSGSESGFNPTWHTMADDLENIDPRTLNAVGQTILNYIFQN